MIPGMDRIGAGAVVAGSASPANVSPPSPAPGQRWRTPDTTYDIVDRVEQYGVLVAKPIDGFMKPHGNQWLTASSFSGWTYLGPTPATPSAAAPAPLPMVAALGSGPPAGYVPCERGGCVRWTYVGGGEVPCCWTCFRGRSPMPATADQHPDWTPPGATTPAPKPTRTPGITCRHCLLTSAGGVDHQPTCTRNDVLTSDSWLTSEAWSTQVRCALERLQDEREKAARPFVPSMLDEDLFGRPVGK